MQCPALVHKNYVHLIPILTPRSFSSPHFPIRARVRGWRHFPLLYDCFGKMEQRWVGCLLAKNQEWIPTMAAGLWSCISEPIFLVLYFSRISCVRDCCWGCQRCSSASGCLEHAGLVWFLQLHLRGALHEQTTQNLHLPKGLI